MAVLCEGRREIQIHKWGNREQEFKEVTRIKLPNKPLKFAMIKNSLLLIYQKTVEMLIFRNLGKEKERFDN